jgi:hypothetical protein
MKAIKIILVLLVFANIPALAQVYNFADVYLQDDCWLYSEGNFRNESGASIAMQGNSSRIYMLSTGSFYNLGSMDNNGSASGGSANGYLLLDGGNQGVHGNSTAYEYLYLRGSGTKTIGVNTTVTSYLYISRPVNTSSNTITFTNTSEDRVVYTSTGYVYGSTGGGLSRVLNSAVDYEFPVGTTGEGQRAVVITPKGTGSQTFKVSAIDGSANGSYSFSSVVGSIGGFNTGYYFHVDRNSGSGVNNVAFYYPSSGEGPFQGIARWNGSAWAEVPGFPNANVSNRWIVATDISSFSPFVFFTSGSTLTVPTLSEWGLIILSLLTLTLVMLFMGRRELAVAGAGRANAGLYSLIQSAPFSRALYFKILSICLLAAIGGFAVVDIFIGKNGLFDVMGTVACSFILAYIIHLYMEFDRFNDKF